MAKPDQIKDEKLRGIVQRAHAELRANKPTDAVKTLCDAFAHLLTLKPELKTRKVAVRPGVEMPFLMRWPQLGANLPLASVMAGNPEFQFVREKFALSEAFTYYEFTLETAIGEGA
jgi:hypothetical protein